MDKNDNRPFTRQFFRRLKYKKAVRGNARLATMPSSCCVPNCNSRYSKAKKVKLFRFPSNPERRHAWIRAIRRKKWLPNRHTRICQFHFVSKKPCHFKYDEDYIPTIFNFGQTRTTESNMARIANWPDTTDCRSEGSKKNTGLPLP